MISLKAQDITEETKMTPYTFENVIIRSVVKAHIFLTAPKSKLRVPIWITYMCSWVFLHKLICRNE